VEKFGGTHHGYFVPTPAPVSAEFSFPDIGGPGPGNLAVALFSFPSVLNTNSSAKRPLMTLMPGGHQLSKEDELLSEI